MIGEFTYDTYLEHLLRRERYLRAERAGFIDALTHEDPREAFPEVDEQEFYVTGFHLGKLYIVKGRARHDDTQTDHGVRSAIDRDPDR